MKKKHPEFARRLLHLRTKAGLSQPELAELAKVDRTAVVHWESGRTKPRDIEAVAKVLGLTIAAFYAAKIPATSAAA